MKVPALSIKPEKAEAQFGWLARFAGHDMPASSVLMHHKVNWKPTGPGLIADLDAMDDTQARACRRRPSGCSQTPGQFA